MSKRHTVTVEQLAEPVETVLANTASAVNGSKRLYLMVNPITREITFSVTKNGVSEYRSFLLAEAVDYYNSINI